MKTKILDPFTRGKQLILRNRRTILIIGLFTVVAFLVIPHLALALDPPAGGTATTSVGSSQDIDKMFQNITSFITFLIKFLERLIWPVLLLIGGLMKNDILFGSGMEDRMLAIWVQIRNFVNILFVLVLLGIAFYNVVGGSNQSFQLKGILPKFVIGLIAVNFSFIGVKLIVDTVGVMTTAIFALPASVQPGLEKNPVGDPNWINTICQGLYGRDKPTYQKNTSDASAWCDSTYHLKTDAQAFFANFDANNAGIVLATNLSKISDWGNVNAGVTDFSGLALNTLFAAALFIVFTTAFIALFAILLVRLIVLWVTLVLSPLIVLTYVLPENIAGSIGGGELKKKFIQNAIAPLPIAIMMTIGFLMLSGLKDAKFSGLSNIGLSTSSVSLGLFTSGLSTLQDLIIAVGTIAVIWMGVFEAAKGTYADGIVNKIKGTVEGVGKFAASAIQYAPIFPVATGAEKPGEAPQKFSLAGGMAAIQNIPNSLNMKAQEEASKLTERWVHGDYAEHERKAREATKPQDLVQAGINMSTGVKDDKPYWQSFGNKMKDQKFRGQILFDGKQIDEQLRLRMQNNEMTAEDKEKGFKALQDYAKLHGGMMPETPAEKKAGETTPGGETPAAGVTTADHTKARGVLESAGVGDEDKRLSDPQKKAVKNYRDAMKGKDRAAADKALQNMQKPGEKGAPSAQAALENIENESKQFQMTAGNLVDDQAALDKAIKDRRTALTGAGLSAQQAEQQLRTDLDGVISRNTKAVQGSIAGGELKKVMAAAPKSAKPEAVSTTAIEEAPGKKAGTGNGKKTPDDDKKKTGTYDADKEAQDYEQRPKDPPTASDSISPGKKWKAGPNGDWIQV